MVPPRPHPPTPSPIAPPSPGRGGATAQKRLNLNEPRGLAGVPPLPVGWGGDGRGGQGVRSTELAPPLSPGVPLYYTSSSRTTPGNPSTKSAPNTRAGV